jgi:hypothetical protein
MVELAAKIIRTALCFESNEVANYYSPQTLRAPSSANG